MSEQDDELQERVCRACNETYRYPVRSGSATRFYCEACSELSIELRALFERQNRRIKALTAQAAKLEQRLQAMENAASHAPADRARVSVTPPDPSA